MQYVRVRYTHSSSHKFLEVVKPDRLSKEYLLLGHHSFGGCCVENMCVFFILEQRLLIKTHIIGVILMYILSTLAPVALNIFFC